jgi:hypothetical protein
MGCFSGDATPPQLARNSLSTNSNGSTVKQLNSIYLQKKVIKKKRKKHYFLHFVGPQIQLLTARNGNGKFCL